MDICVIGAGYVGLTTAAALAERGHKVVCVDIDKIKITQLQSNKSAPIYEPGLDKLIKANMSDKKQNLSFTTQTHQAVRKAFVVFVCVGTPPLEDQSLDVSYVENTVAQIAGLLEPDDYKLIVIKSTVPVGTCARLKEIIRSKMVEGADFDIVSNPEFMREGHALEDIFNADRIVIGTDGMDAAQVMMEVYEAFENRFVLTDLESSEMIKLASNAFLATKISFINSIAVLCEKTGANVDEVSRGIGFDHRIGEEFLRSGIGYGGSCFPKDVNHILEVGKTHGVDLSIIRSAKETNDSLVDVFIKKIEDHLGDLKGKTIAVWGVSFKPNTDDVRHSQSLIMIDKLLRKGAHIRAHDPAGMKKAKQVQLGVAYAANEFEPLVGADALVIATEWQQYAKADISQLVKVMNSPIVFDGRNMFDPQEMASYGIKYISIGRATVEPSKKALV